MATNYKVAGVDLDLTFAAINELGTSATSTLTTTSSTEAVVKAVTPAQGTYGTSNDVRLTLKSTFTSGSDPDDDAENEGNASILLDGADNWYITSHYDYGFTIDDTGLTDEDARFYMSEGGSTRFNDSYGNRQLSLNAYGNGPVFEGHSGNMWLTIYNSEIPDGDDDPADTGIKMYSREGGFALESDHNQTFHLRKTNSVGTLSYSVLSSDGQAINLSYQSNVKLSTKSNGVKMFGDVDIQGTSASISILSTASNSTHVLNFYNTTSGSQVYFYNGQYRVYQMAGSITSREKLWINTSRNAGVTLYYNSLAKMATSNTGITVTGTVAESSDEKLKLNQCVVSNALDKIQKINGYTYYRSDTKAQSAGVFAQEIQEILPEIVTEVTEVSVATTEEELENEVLETSLAVQYSGLSALYIEAIKELNTKVDAMQAIIDAQQIQINQLLDDVK